MSRANYSRFGLAFCLLVGLTAGGCAAGGWNRFMGKKSDEPAPRTVLAWSRLKEHEGRLTEARNGYEKVLSREPRNADALLGMARLNVKAQRLVEAGEGFERVLAMYPKSPVVLSEVGNFYVEQQRWDRAIPLLQEAQRIEPHEKSHQFALALALTKADRIDEARPHFTEAVGEAAAHYNIGRWLVETGKTTEAEQEFNLALAKDPNLTDARYFLDEMKANQAGNGDVPVVAQQQPAAPVAQQVSASAPSSSRPVVTPATNERRQVRPPLYPHAGYEELPPPAEMQDGASLAPSSKSTPGAIVQTGYSPPASGPIHSPSRPQLTVSPMPDSPPIRLSATTQIGR